MKIKKDMFQAREEILENGLQIISIQKDSNIFSLHVGMDIGAMYEKIEEKGISHFIEHMLFKGTKKRDNHMINQAFEERAGAYDAYTDYDATVFSITALADELEASVEILSDMLTNATFPSDEIEKEKKVILAEVKAYKDDVEQYTYKKTNELAFRQSPLKYDVIGVEKIIKSFTKPQLEAFYHAHYIPNQCIMSVVSPYSHDEIVEIIKKYFGKWKKGKILDRKITIEKNHPLQKTSYKSNIEQNTLMYLYTFYGLSRKEELALEILNHKLGVSANSILFQVLREDHGIAYDVYSEMDATEAIKSLYIYTAVAEEDLGQARNEVENCIEAIKTRKGMISEKDITLMKKVIKTGVASMLEDAAGLSSYVLHQKISKKNIYGFIEDMENLEHIQEKDIFEIAQKVLKEPTIHVLRRKNKKEKEA
ncbi:pitrilysin family protein [Clostridiaceae bacterium 35-E11]